MCETMGGAVRYDEITYEVSDGIATITLNRPARLNAFTLRMGHELLAAFDEADADDSVRVVVLTGAGRAYCAGADLEMGGGTFNRDVIGAEEFGQIDGVPRDEGGVVSLRVAACKKVVIGAFNGAAVGIGVTMTLPMDIRIASTNAKFGFVFARRGILPEAASSWFLPRVVGISQAMEWVATGRLFDAAEARAGGLVSRVVAPDELIPTARSIAREVADNTSAVSVAVSRQLLWGMLGAPTPWDAHRQDSRAMLQLGAGKDVVEGVTAFLEKRPPNFPGRVSTDYPEGIRPFPGPP